MSDKTLKMARQLYAQMCEYYGPEHEKRCVEAMNFTLGSMESEIERLRAENERLKFLFDNHKQLIAQYNLESE